MNLEESTFPLGTAAQEETVSYRIDGDTETFMADGITAEGGTDVFTYTARYGDEVGKYYSSTIITESNSVSVERVDERTVERTDRPGGHVTEPTRTVRTVSADGSQLIATVFKTDASGQESRRETRVYQRRSRGDSFSGTWELDIATSELVPESRLAAETVTIQVSGNQETFRSEAMSTNDVSRITEYTVRYGREAEASVEENTRRMIRLFKVDDNTRERHSLLDGEVTGKSRRVLTDDGTVLHTYLIGLDAQGNETVNQVRVFDKIVE